MAEREALLYERLAGDVAALVKSGALHAGDRLPSVRRTSVERRVSVATVLAAYARLEADGLVEARPKSGYFVRRQAPAHIAPRPPVVLAPSHVSVASGVGALVDSMRDASIVALGSASIDPELLPIRSLNRTLAAIAREVGTAGATYDVPPGLAPLRRQLARRSLT